MTRQAPRTEIRIPPMLTLLACVDADEGRKETADDGTGDAEQGVHQEPVLGIHEDAGKPADQSADADRDDDVYEHFDPSLFAGKLLKIL